MNCDIMFGRIADQQYWGPQGIKDYRCLVSSSLRVCTQLWDHAGDALLMSLRFVARII